MPATAATQPPLLVCALAWLVPGAGHFLLGRNRSAVVLFSVLTFMYAFGLWLGGRLFPVATPEPLVLLSALAQWSVGLPRLAALIGDFGAGDIVAATYEYGNTFLIVGGLLNTLAVLQVYDVAVGQR